MEILCSHNLCIIPALTSILPLAGSRGIFGDQRWVSFVCASVAQLRVIGLKWKNSGG